VMNPKFARVGPGVMRISDSPHQAPNGCHF
jgi:hypothetical protein